MSTGVEQRHLCFAADADTQTHMFLPGEALWLVLDRGGTGAGASHTNDEAKSTGPSGEGRQLGSSCAGVVLAWRRKHKTITYSLKEKKKDGKTSSRKTNWDFFAFAWEPAPTSCELKTKRKGRLSFKVRHNVMHS